MTKPTLSDVARQNNSSRVSKFANSIIPAAPEQDTPPPAETPASESLSEKIEKVEVDFAEGRGTVFTVDELKNKPNVPPAPVAKPTRKRSGTLSLEDIISDKAPDGENFGKMTRIAEKHHDLLREIAFKHRKNMNTILYNLLEVLDQTYQHDQQNHA